MAVSSAKVLMIVLLDCGMSAVYIIYNSGPKMLPWGTPENTRSGREVSLLYVATEFRFCNYDCRSFKDPGGRVCLIFSRRP
jgi:hypothetical protein